MKEDETIASHSAAKAAEWNLENIVGGLRQARRCWRTSHPRNDERDGRSLPSRQALEHIMLDLCGALFPMRLGPSDLRQEGEDFYVGRTLDSALRTLTMQAYLELRHAVSSEEEKDEALAETARYTVQKFATFLPNARMLLDSDVEAAFASDPAARSVDEILLCYPGILAMIHFRIAHRLFQLGLPLIARIISEIAHSRTGIDIHPGASIGSRFFIDHGTGVVIGETAVIGNGVRLYQAVTLGAKSFPSDSEGLLRKGLPRHPIVEDNVVIYAGATILGRVTIGQGSTIGGNVWLTESIPPNSHITQARSAERTS